jgi:NADH:ubiquinone oxidoreductase subunit 6 (subunit J)
MTLELVIFIVVAAVAIFSAASMLVSRNAVHSALFLVLNFLCVSFFYLMLNAPFLAMIQVTVYAGAIMVLFIFVIMLLGSERLGGADTRYPWLAPAAVGLTTILLITAFYAIVQGNLASLQPVPPPPQIRVTNAAAGVPAVDIYLNETKVASDVTYHETSEFTQARAGDYNLLAFPACEEANPARCPDPIQSGAAPIMAVPVKLEPDTTTTFVVMGSPDQLQLLAVPTDLKPLENEDTARLTAINALPGSGTLSLVKPNPDEQRFSDPDQRQKAIAAAQPIVENLGGETGPAKTVVLPQGTYNLAWQRTNGDNIERILVVPELTLRPKTHEMLILAPEIPAGQQSTRPAVIRVEPVVKTQEPFGSPQQIGQTMLGAFLLPFELVSLLLLAAMVGAIILTREEVAKRVRQRLVVSPAVRRINRGAAARPSPETEPSAD